MDNIKKRNLRTLYMGLAFLTGINVVNLFLFLRPYDIKGLHPGHLWAEPLTSLTFLLGALAVTGKFNEQKWFVPLAWAAGIFMMALGLPKAIILLQNAMILPGTLFSKIPEGHGWDGAIVHEVAINNTVGFLILGVMFMSMASRHGAINRFLEYGGFVAAGAGLIAMVGYLYRAPELYSVPGLDPMSVVTGLSLGILPFALLGTQYDKGVFGVFFLKQEGSRMARALIPLVVIIPLLTGFIHLWAEQANGPSGSLGAALFTVINVIILLYLIWNYSIYLNQVNDRLLSEINDRTALEEQLKRANIDLEAIVQERTEKIRETETRFHSMSYFSTDINIICDEQERMIYISPAIREILGYSPESMTGKMFQELLHPDSAATYSDVHELLLSKPMVPQSTQLLARHRNGQAIWLEGTLNNLLSDPGIQGVMANLQDVTARKSAEDALLFSEEKYRNLFYNNPACIIIWYLDDLTIAEINHTVVQTYGYSYAEFMRLSVLDLRPPEDHATIRSFANDMLQAPSFQTISRTWRHLHKDGHVMYMQITSHKFEYNGRPAIISIQLNETMKVLLEQKLEEEQARNMREITSAVINAQEREREEIGRELHDNINPLLAASRLYLGLVKSSVERKEGEEDFLGETDKILLMAIENVRQLSHTLVRPRLSPDEFEASVGALVNLFAKSSGMQVEQELDDLGDAADDEDLLLSMYRIFQEQMNNILKYSHATHVTVGVRNTVDSIILRIADDGVGFDPNIQPQGVGLRNIRTRAAVFEGELIVNTAPGKGCELVVVFPKKAERDWTDL